MDVTSPDQDEEKRSWISLEASVDWHETHKFLKCSSVWWSSVSDNLVEFRPKPFLLIPVQSPSRSTSILRTQHMEPNSA